MQRRHVAIIGTRGYPSYYGGFETAVRRIAPYLVERGWDVTVYGRPGGVKADDPYLDDRVASRITWGVETKSLSTLSYGLSASLDAVRRRPDVALVMNVANGYWLPILRAAKIPTLVNVDGIEWDRAKWGRLAKAMFRGGARMTSLLANELVMDARAIDARWEADLGRGGVFIPYGGDEPGETDAPLGLTKGSYALLVARFVPENSIEAFFRAVPNIASQRPVVIVGSSGYGGDFDDQARDLAEKNSNVKWLGHLSDDRLLHSLWQNCGAYFHGHTVGGTNPALVQAMACGAPIIARETVYNSEVLNFPTAMVGDDPDSIAAAVLKLIGDPAEQKRRSRSNLNRARHVYNWDAICRAYEEQLEFLIARRLSKAGN